MVWSSWLIRRKRLNNALTTVLERIAEKGKIVAKEVLKRCDQSLRHKMNVLEELVV